MTTGAADPGSGGRVIAALHRIVQHIQSEGDLPQLLHSIMEESKDLLDSDASSLFLYDQERGDLYFEVVVGGSDEIRAIRVPMGQGIVGATAASRETLVVNDCASDPRHLKIGGGGFVTRNLVAVPMIRNDRLIGVLEVLNKREGRDYSEEDRMILEIIAEQAAAQIEATRLIRAKIQAERLAALGTTAAGLAHYIKNVLSQWKGSASLIDLGLARNNQELINDAWPILKRANNKISKLVQDMLAISRERQPERQPVDLNKMILEILEDTKERAAKGEVNLTAKLDPELPETLLDPTRIHDSILNLVGNAVEAIEEAKIQGGSVTVVTKFDAGTHWITITIEDTGPGMKPEIKARVLEPFFSTKGSRGTGLGLAVVNKAIEEHGGKLRLDSEFGKGTTFTLELPAVED